MTDFPTQADQIAAAFVTARRDARALHSYPGAKPADLDIAYRIQAGAIRLWGEAVSGWKVGLIPREQQGALGSNRLVGPIFASRVMTTGNDAIVEAPVFDGGFAAVEAEFVAVLGADLPPGQRCFSSDEAAAMIEKIYCGIEIASSPLASVNAAGSAVTISDFGNNAGLILGPEVPDWRNSGFADWRVDVALDGSAVGQGRGSAIPDGPVGAVRFLLETAAARGLAVGRGTLISTGAITGVHEAGPGAVARATFGDFASLACRLIAATPNLAAAQSALS